MSNEFDKFEQDKEAGFKAYIPRRGWHYWIYCIYQGRPVIDGPYSSEGEAYQFGSKKMPASFQIHYTNTIDRARATQEIKHKIWTDGASLDEALHRAKHVK